MGSGTLAVLEARGNSECGMRNAECAANWARASAEGRAQFQKPGIFTARKKQ
jgi:hypothetical protein